MALPSFRDFMGKKERKARNEYEQTIEGAPIYTPPAVPPSPSSQPLPSFSTYMSQRRPAAEPSPVTAAPALQQPSVATVPPAAVPASASAFDRKEIARSAAAVPQPTPLFEQTTPAPLPVSPLAKALGIDPNAPSQIRQANTGDRISQFITSIPEKVKQTLLTAGAGIIEASGIDDLMNRTERASIRNQVPVADLPREYQEFAQRQRDERMGMATAEGWDKNLNTMTKDISPVTKGAAKFVGNMIVEIPMAMGAASLGGVPFLTQATKVKKLGDWIRGGSTAAKIVASAITGAGTGLTKGVIEEAGRSLVNSDVEAFDALQSLQAVGGSTLDYTLYSALYPGINKGLERVPFGKLGKVPGAIAEGVVAGGAAGLGVGAMKAGGQFVWDAANGDAKDVSTYLKSIVTESGQEVSEEVVEAIGLAIANALTKGGAGGRRRYSKIEVRHRASETAQQQVSNIQSVRSSASIVPGPNVPAMIELLSRRGFEEVEAGSGLYAKRDQKTGQWDTAQAFELQEQAKTSKASANLVDKYLKDRQDLTTALGISPLEANLARVVTSFGKSLSDIDETQTVEVGDKSIRIGEIISWTEQVKRVPTDVEISDAELKGKQVPKQITGAEAIEGVVVGTLPRADGNHTVLIADETGKVVTRQSNYLAARLRGDSTEQDNAAQAPAVVNRAQLLRDANPGMDEKAIMDMVKTTSNLSDAEFQGFAQRVGKVQAPGATSTTPPSGTPTTVSPTAQAETVPRTFPGWHTPVTKGGEAKARLQGTNLPDGMFIALDQPFESDVHDKSQARQVSVSVQNTFDPDGLMDPSNAAKHGSIIPAFTAAVNKAFQKNPNTNIRTFYTGFLKAQGFDSYVRGIDGDPKNRELIVFDRGKVTTKEAAATTKPTLAPANEYAGQTFTHFTTPEGKAALESGAPFDFGINPQHGTGDLSDGPKTGRFAGNALYLSLNDKRWGTANRDTGVGNVEPSTSANDGKGQTFYDYDKQKWMVRIGGSEKVPLQRVSYTLAADAKVLTIDSEEALKKAVHEASIAMGKKVYPVDDDALWEGLAKRYDAVAIRNADKLDGKFFRAASGDQLIVLNQAKATVVKPEVPAQTTQGAPGSSLSPEAPNPSPQTPAPAQQAGVNAPEPTAKEPWEMTREEFQRGKMRYLGPDSVATGERKAGMAWTQTQQAELDFAKRLELGLHPTAHDGLMVYAKTEKDASALVNALNTGVRDPALSRLLGYTDEDRKALAKYGWQAHRDAIADALSRGKSVPPEVLAEYPDLQPKVEVSDSGLEGKARAAFSNDAAFQNFLRNPKGWQILLTKPDSPQGRYWIEKRAADAGNGVSPKIGDLLMEQKSLLGQSQTKTVRDSLARVQKDLEQAIQLAIKPADKTALERVAAGEEAISLTGKPLPPGALEGRVEKPTTPEPAPQAPQQGTLFDKPVSLSEVDQRRADLETELADVRRDWAEVGTKRDAAIDKLAAKLAKDATAENDRLRKEFWTRIKNTGYIRPYADGYLKEDLLSRVPNHLKRKNGAMNLDALASAMGYESDEALVKEIEQFERARSVDPRRFANQAEELADYEHPDLKQLNDYYRQAEQEVLSAIDELESGKDGEDQGEAATAGRVTGAAADTRAGAGQVPGDGAGGSEESPRRGGASQEDALATRSTDKAVDDVQAMAAPGRLLGSTPPAVSKGAVKRLDIVRHFTEGLKVPIRQGRFLQHALGIFKVRQEAIRTKLAEDLRTITHEVGHYLDKRFTLRDAAFDAELLPLGHPTSRPSYTKDQVRAEGVAEFTNLYLTDKTAANQVAPKFFARFERALSGEPKVRKVILTGQDMLHTYVAQNATDMVKSGISYTPPADPITWQVMKQKAFDLYAAWVDKHDPILVAEKALNNGKQLPTRLSPKAQADLSRGWEGLAKAFLEKGAQRWDDATQSFKTVGPSLEAILDPVADKLDDFAAYTAAMRALYLAKTRQNPDGTPWDDHKFPFPLWAARDTVRKYSSPEFATALKQLQHFQDAVLDYYGDAGFLTVEQRRQIRKQNLIYVPFLREQMKEGPGMRQVLGPKYASLRNAVVKMKGGTGTIINPLHSIIHNTFKLINLAQRNHVAVALANLADVAEGGADIIEDVTKSFRPATFSLEQIKDALEDAGADLDTIDLDAMATVFSPNHMPTAGDAAKGIFGVYRNGQTKFYQTDPELYRALNAMDKPAFNWAIRALSVVTKPKRTFAVLTPEFIARNLGRDVLTAAVYGRGLPLEAHMRGLIAQVFDKEAVTRWEAGGGFHSSTVSVDRDYQKETILNLAHRNAKLLKENLLPPWRALQNLGEIIERSPRIGELLLAEKGNALERIVGLGPGPVDTPTAILETRDLTLDFGRSGNQGQQLNQITAFFNAATQDVDKFARMHSNPKTAGRVIARGLAFITLPTLLLWLRNKDDEEYKEFPQWRKDLAWNFKIGGRWYWYPAPHTLALVYKTMPERILNAIYQENPKALTKGLGETVSSAAVPNLVPDALALLAELKFNWNLFGDRPIVPRGEAAKEAAQQAGPYTTETAKRIGTAINVAPRKVDHAVQGVLASGGRYALAASDKALEVVGRATGAPVPPAKSERESAFVRAFSSENPLSSGAESINDFYDLKQRHDTLWASLPGRVGVDKPLGEYANFTTAERDALVVAVRNLSKSEQELIGGDFQRWRTITKKALNKAEDQLSTYSKAKRAVEASTLMSAEQKRKEIDRIDRLRLDLARKTLGKPPL